MIVVEGFDGAGKTTLCGALGEALGWPVHHTGGPTRGPADVAECLLRSRLRFAERCVQDRCTHISESVYSMTTRPGQASRALVHLHELTEARVVVYCRPGDEYLLESIRYHRAKKHETARHVDDVIENAVGLIGIYDTVMALVENARPVRRYDFSRDSQSEFVKTVRGDLSP